MSVGISTACFYPAATEEALRCVAEAGAKVTEVFFNSPSELEPVFLRRLSSIASDNGIRIRSLHPFTSFAEGYILFSQYVRRFDDYALEVHGHIVLKSEHEPCFALAGDKRDRVAEL